MKFTGASAVDVALGATQLLDVGTGSGSFPGAIIRTGGGSTTFSGGNGVRFGSGLIWYVYTDTAADTVIFNNPMVALSNNHLSKNGLGTMVQGSTSNITGQSFINEGTMLINGAHTAGASYWVNAGATLGGTGSITTAVLATNNVQVAGTLAPGNSLAVGAANQTAKLTINTTAVNFASGSTFAAQLGGTAPGAFDQLALTNNLAAGPTAGVISLTGTVTLNLSWVGAGSPAGTYLIIDTSLFTTAPTWATMFSGTTNGGTVGISGMPAAYSGTISYAPGGVTITVVPEPQEYAIGIAALLGLVIFLRRRAVTV
jgi:hypothetical protein